jgi:hypothetical protein
LVIDGDAAIRVGHARTIEREPRDIRTTTGGNQESLSLCLADSVRRDDDSSGLLSHRGPATPKPSDPIAFEHALKDSPRL